MLTSVSNQMPTVLVSVPGYASPYIPAEDIDTHRMLSTTALKIAQIDEPICCREWYLEHEGHYWGHLEIVYHHDHVIKWAEIREALRYDLITGGLLYFEPRSFWDDSLRLQTQFIRVNFIPTVRR